ncbi:MAG TPA: hypothetical protein VFV82_04635, partial [Candidatus Binatia bacterium]|nr:hypothetical protein [Candidatus Binatia bacterium]
FSAPTAAQILRFGELRDRLGQRAGARRWLSTARRVGVIAAFVFTAAAFAADAAVLLEARVGFHGVFQLGRPFPVEIELTNTGRPEEGMVEVQVWKGGVTKGGAAYATYYQHKVFLAAQARKTIQLTVDPDFISRPLVVRFAGTGAAAARDIDLRRHFSPAPVVLMMTGNSTLPAVTFTPAQSRVVALTPLELAADSRALLGVSHLILYDQSLRDLTRAQLLALDNWLLAGGKIVVIGSLNYALYQEAKLARFLPVRVEGAKQISFTPGPEGSQKRPAIADVWALSSTLVNGQVVAELGGMPLIVQAARGRGQITYLALDVGRPPLSHWEGLPKFLQTLLSGQPTEGAPVRTHWNDAVFNQLIASPRFIATYVPSASLFAAILSYFAVLAAVLWLWQKKRVAPKLLVLGLIAFLAAAGTAGYVYFSRGGNIPEGVLLISTVLENTGDDFVEAQANLALFSTQLRHYDLQLDRGWIDLTPVISRARENSEPAVITQDAGGASRYRLSLREWDYRLFRLRRIERFPLSADFQMQGERLVLTVSNRSSKDLAHCWLLLPGQRFDLGTIARGASWQRSFALAHPSAVETSGGARGETLQVREVSFADKTRDILFHSSIFARDLDPRWSGGVAVFFGWVEQPDARVRVDHPRIQAQDYALFRAVFPLSAGEDE